MCVIKLENQFRVHFQLTSHELSSLMKPEVIELVILPSLRSISLGILRPKKLHLKWLNRCLKVTCS